MVSIPAHRGLQNITHMPVCLVPFGRPTEIDGAAHSPEAVIIAAYSVGQVGYGVWEDVAPQPSTAASPSLPTHTQPAPLGPSQ